MKDLLEVKQRAVRKHKDQTKEEHEIKYFEKWFNPSDKMDYYVYNGRYFEKDKKELDWSRSQDIFSNQCSPEVYNQIPTKDKKRFVTTE